MDIKNFVLSYYKNSIEGFHVQKIVNSVEAKKPHSHDYFQFYYVAKGRLTHYLLGQTSTLERGDMFIVPPSTVHHISTEDNTVFYACSFMEEFIQKTIENNLLARNFLNLIRNSENIRAKVSISTDEILNVEMITSSIHKEFNEKKFGYEDTIRIYLNLIIMLFARRYMEKISTDDIMPSYTSLREIVLSAVEYVEKNCTEKIKLADITKMLAVSKSSFCKLFLALTGKTYNEYVNDCRIKKSLEYLQKGYNATAIHGLLGYDDYSTFHRNFVKIMGTTPNKYKKQNF